MKKLNLKGFAHWIVPALVVVVIGGIGTYLVVGSHANVPSLDGGGGGITKSQCAAKSGVWLDLQSDGVDHSPCWSTPGAYIVNFGHGTEDGEDKIDQVTSGHSEKMNYPNYIIVVSGTWKLCNDVPVYPDLCTSGIFNHSATKASAGTYGPYANLCNTYTLKNSAGNPHLKACTARNVYIQKT